MPRRSRRNLLVLIQVTLLLGIWYYVSSLSSSDPTNSLTDLYERSRQAAAQFQQKGSIHNQASPQQGAENVQEKVQRLKGEELGWKKLAKELEREKGKVEHGHDWTEIAKKLMEEKKAEGVNMALPKAGVLNGMAAKVKGEAVAGAAAGVKEVKDILKSGEGAVKAAAGVGVDVAGEEKAEEEVVFDAEAEIQSILTKNPLTMFSKSYCPYCKRAKAVLASHTISPPPYILELDLDPNGPAIQSALAAHSGRKTVPQIFVGDGFLGGGDDVVGLERDGELVGVIREKSAGRITIS
ncbi:hypothetical protein YB2330_006659 [Saitoella coloradoensis]